MGAPGRHDRPQMSDDHRLEKHSLVIAGHRTSVTLERLFWRKLQQEAQKRGLSAPALVGEIDAYRLSLQPTPNLSSAIRVFLMRESA